jgi:hypothetical protein
MPFENPAGTGTVLILGIYSDIKLHSVSKNILFCHKKYMQCWNRAAQWFHARRRERLAYYACRCLRNFTARNLNLYFFCQACGI